MTFNEVILGCSTFTQGFQFGHRSRLYELDFANQPENIREVIDSAYELGVKNIMLKHNNDLEEAIKLSQKNNKAWNVIGQSDTSNFNRDMDIFNNFNTTSVIMDGICVDKCIETSDYDELISCLDKIKSNGYMAGIETRTPFKNLPLLKESEIIDKFDIIMIPVNFYGYMVDCNFFDSENRDEYSKLVKSLNKKVIANRTLATGILKPQEAYDFIKTLDYIDSVCVGIAKVSEAEETLNIINNVKA